MLPTIPLVLLSVLATIIVASACQGVFTTWKRYNRSRDIDETRADVVDHITREEPSIEVVNFVYRKGSYRLALLQRDANGSTYCSVDRSALANEKELNAYIDGLTTGVSFLDQARQVAKIVSQP